MRKIETTSLRAEIVYWLVHMFHNVPQMENTSRCNVMALRDIVGVSTRREVNSRVHEKEANQTAVLLFVSERFFIKFLLIKIFSYFVINR